MRSYSQIHLKNFNRIALLNYIRRHGSATRAGLASVTGLTFMAMKKILEELMGLNLVRLDAQRSVTMGRKSAAYRINESYGYTVGLHINIYETRAAVMNLSGEIVARNAYMEPTVPDNQLAFMEKVITLVQQTIRDSGIDSNRLLGLGIGTPGPVNSTEGVVLTPPNFPPLRYLPIGKIMENRLGLPTLVEKDTNVLALGEYWYGEGAALRPSFSNLVYIDADMGIGSGLILDGELYRSKNDLAGEFGHITLDLNGPRCNCGNLGCLEAMGSGLAIQKTIASRLTDYPSHPLYAKRDDLSIGDILDCAARDDILCVTALNQSAYYMGTAINSLVNLLDPDSIVLGGVLAQGYRSYFDIVSNTVSRRHLRNSAEPLLVRSQLGADAGVIGAGELVADHFFTELVNKVFSKESPADESAAQPLSPLQA